MVCSRLTCLQQIYSLTSPASRHLFFWMTLPQTSGCVCVCVCVFYLRSPSLGSLQRLITQISRKSHSWTCVCVYVCVCVCVCRSVHCHRSSRLHAGDTESNSFRFEYLMIFWCNYTAEAASVSAVLQPLCYYSLFKNIFLACPSSPSAS